MDQSRSSLVYSSTAGTPTMEGGCYHELLNMKLRSGKTSQYNPFFSGQEDQQAVSETSKRAHAGTKEHDNEDYFLAEDDRSFKPVFLS